MKRVVDRFRVRFDDLERQRRASDDAKAMLGRLLARGVHDRTVDSLRDVEFSVFSQFGEDGIIQFLIKRVPIEREVFVEIGVETYGESNTRFLVVNDNWKGYIFDRTGDHIEFVERTGLAWRHGLKAVRAHISRENVNEVLAQAGAEGDIGLFSLDIDGNDYWVLDALSIVSPRILVAEYNSLFGPTAAITVPYDPSFDRSKAHYSYLYWGASLAALDEVAGRKGYQLVGSNSAGNNAFFVRRDVAGDLPVLTTEKAYVRSRFQEARDPEGNLTYTDPHEEGLALIRELPVWNVGRGIEEPLGQALAGGT